MKILNTTPRDSDTAIQMTAISELNPTSNLNKDSLIHIASYIDEVGGEKCYQSMRMDIGTFENKLYQSVQNTLKTAYWDTHIGAPQRDGDISGHKNGCEVFARMIEYLEATPKVTIPEVGEDAPFVNHIWYDFEVLISYIVKKNYEITEEFNDVDDRINTLDCYFDSVMELTTTDEKNLPSNISVNHLKSENDTYAQMDIKEGNKISNTWMVPETGSLVIYGWLDSSACLNNRAIPSAFCVIEGYINEKWEIIAVQPVLPAKSITYVGFTIPVHGGLNIRARTGFPVGAKSSQYPKEEDGFDSLSNSVANGFRCQVFSYNKTKKEDDE